MRLSELEERLSEEGAVGPEATGDAAWKPWLIDLGPGEPARFRSLCDDNGISVFDRIVDQLGELAAIRYPAEGSDAERRTFVRDALARTEGGAHYGVWACLPWESKVVHLLARDDFFDVVTSRNQEKITRAEQLSLRSRRVGVVGLSVGAEIAVSVAQEHLCGSIVLADFDRLELSNLNRLGAGVDDLGVNKAHLAARRIARIDPYLEVEVLSNGIDRENAEAFLEGLDLLIEECDGLDLKLHLRELARRRRLDVIYAADERGLLSIEPYRTHPDYPLFHGHVEGTSPSCESLSTTSGYIDSLLAWLGGRENLSERSRLSVAKIGDTLCGYPQLASEPRLAAGQIGHVARRLLLGEPLPPLLAHFDLDEAVPGADPSRGEQRLQD